MKNSVLDSDRNLSLFTFNQFNSHLVCFATVLKSVTFAPAIFWIFVITMDVTHFVANKRTVQEYLCYLHIFTEVPQGAAYNRFMALAFFWSQHGSDCDRKRHPSVRRMLASYCNRKPFDVRFRNLFTFVHVQKAL